MRDMFSRLLKTQSGLCKIFMIRIEAVTDNEKVLKQIAIERRQIERKLYQPPLIKE